jgi:hypothetical protein
MGNLLQQAGDKGKQDVVFFLLVLFGGMVVVL